MSATTVPTNPLLDEKYPSAISMKLPASLESDPKISLSNEKVTSIDAGPEGPAAPNITVSTIVPGPETIANVVDETGKTAPVNTIAPDTTDPTTLNASRIEEKEFIPGVIAHDRAE